MSEVEEMAKRLLLDYDGDETRMGIAACTTIAEIVQWWRQYDGRKYTDKEQGPTAESAIYALPSNPTHGQLAKWEAGLKTAASLLRSQAAEIKALKSQLATARNDALEEAAKVAEEFNGMKHAAHDVATGVWPKQSYMGEAIATAIRAKREK